MERDEKQMTRTNRRERAALGGEALAPKGLQAVGSESVPRGGLLGCPGEQALQERLGTRRRARAFYANQVLDHLNPMMQAFIARQELCFIATADARGNCDCSLRAGPVCFVQVADAGHLWYPEYRGNGVMASLANIAENPHIGLIFIDFFETTVGLHVNGRARRVEGGDAAITTLDAPIGREPSARPQPQPERWVQVEVEDAYIHGSKHVPLLQKLDKVIWWGTDNAMFKGGDYFRAKGTHAIQHPAAVPGAAIVEGVCLRAAPSEQEDLAVAVAGES